MTRFHENLLTGCGAAGDRRCFDEPFPSAGELDDLELGSLPVKF